jgi:lactate permease
LTQSGTDAVGLAFTGAGSSIRSSLRTWDGSVFLTGSDTASNIFSAATAHHGGAAQPQSDPHRGHDSTGGVMGKMIDAQSIMVACAAC